MQVEEFRVCSEEDFYWIRVRGARRSCGNGVQEFDQLLGGMSREAVGGVADDIGVKMLAEMKAYCAAARTASCS